MTNTNRGRNKPTTSAVKKTANNDAGQSKKLPVQTKRDGSQVFTIPLRDSAPEHMAKRIADHFDAEVLKYRWEDDKFITIFTDGRKVVIIPEKMPSWMKSVEDKEKGK